MTVIEGLAEIIGDTLSLIIGEKTNLPVLRETEAYLYWYIF